MTPSQRISRRRALATAAASVAALSAGRFSTMAAEPALPAAKHGRIKQSLVNWCYRKYWEDMDKFCETAKRLGCVSIELCDPKDWPTLKKHGLVCAIAGSHGFTQGMNNPKHQEMCLDKLRTAIDNCATFGFQSVITFTGFREDIPDDVGIKNCVAGFKKIIGYAEEKKVNLCIEMLNSRVNIEMKGHPGYQGDHTDYCIDIIKQVGSPRMKLLFDIYHVQIMDGDIITRIKQHADYIGHIHTAGNPGRGELDEAQEISMKALLDVGYKGYVGKEFIPTRDPMQGLTEAVALCDV